jgi:hypothetical protein
MALRGFAGRDGLLVIFQGNDHRCLVFGNVHFNPLGALAPGAANCLLNLALKYPGGLVTHLISPGPETGLMEKSTYHIAASAAIEKPEKHN